MLGRGRYLRRREHLPTAHGRVCMCVHSTAMVWYEMVTNMKWYRMKKREITEWYKKRNSVNVYIPETQCVGFQSTKERFGI